MLSINMVGGNTHIYKIDNKRDFYNIKNNCKSINFLKNIRSVNVHLKKTVVTLPIPKRGKITFFDVEIVIEKNMKIAKLIKYDIDNTLITITLFYKKDSNTYKIDILNLT